jgi:hypothetical protein
VTQLLTSRLFLKPKTQLMSARRPKGASNAVYGSGAPHRIVLPEVLSENAVLVAVRKARTTG